MGKEKSGRMTREELRDYVDEQFYNIPYHVYSELIDGIDTLELEPDIDKIRAEIRTNSFYVMPQYGRIIREADVLHILDKYKAESGE